MKLYVDESNNDSYVEYTGKVTNLRASPQMRQGGGWSATYLSTAQDLSSELDTLRANKGVKIEIRSL